MSNFSEDRVTNATEILRYGAQRLWKQGDSYIATKGINYISHIDYLLPFYEDLANTGKNEYFTKVLYDNPLKFSDIFREKVYRKIGEQ